MALTKAEIRALADEAVAGVRAARGDYIDAVAAVPEARQVRKALSAKVKRESGEDVLAIGLAIASDPAMKRTRSRWVGWELINKHKGAMAALDMPMVEALGAGNSSWDEVDGYGTYIAGPAWLSGLAADADVVAWARSPDLWIRRRALVATVVLNAKSHGGTGDARRTLMIADLLKDDREDMIVKAMSWALRMLVSWDRDAVENFLAVNEDRLAARVKREVNTKLLTGKKNATKPARPPGA